MNKVNIHDAKTHLSEYIASLKEGETLILCRRNRPIAELRLLPQPIKEKRPVGLARDIFQVPESFFEPLPDRLLNLFEPHGHETAS